MVQDGDLCKGLRVLLVEDEAIIAMLTEHMLREMGCEHVHFVGSVPLALSVIERDPPDVAVLDVNLRGAMVLPVAQKLAKAGIPFAFATAYGKTEMLAEFHHYPILQKPFDMPDLENALRSAMGTAQAATATSAPPAPAAGPAPPAPCRSQLPARGR